MASGQDDNAEAKGSFWPRRGHEISGGASVTARSAEDLFRTLALAVRAGDVEAFGAQYEDDAVLAEPGRAVRGATAIADLLRGFLAAEPRFELLGHRVIEAGDVALIHASWRLHLHGTIEEVRPTLLARRQVDGSWKVVIDSPAGCRVDGG
jgi:ketosteroid isomerase-like protein